MGDFANGKYEIKACTQSCDQQTSVFSETEKKATCPRRAKKTHEWNQIT